ncbi:hypothetical protein BC834DRAFT_853402 [Gloeopeniophorella convolvens]|nr:hypothetical protein BC834DRAFT_853402 [Gloeopeniophorella convolvens]
MVSVLPASFKEVRLPPDKCGREVERRTLARRVTSRPCRCTKEPSARAQLGCLVPGRHCAMGAVALWRTEGPAWASAIRGRGYPVHLQNRASVTALRRARRCAMSPLRRAANVARAPRPLCFGTESCEASHSGVMAHCASGSSGREGKGSALFWSPHLVNLTIHLQPASLHW